MFKNSQSALDERSSRFDLKEILLILSVAIVAIIFIAQVPKLSNQPPKAGIKRVLEVPKFSQQPHEHLCGAAVASMAAAYLNGDEKDRTEEMAKRFFGEADFNKPLFIEDISESIEVFANKKAKIANSPLSFKAVKYQIDLGFPIIVISYHKGLGFSHGEIIIGYDETGETVIYNDPWDGKEKTKPYSDYLDGDRSSWIDSAYFG